MNASEYIVEVSESDFEYEVVNFSRNTPVVVDFWAVWCGPCKTLTPILERLAEEAHGAFRLAKLNVDDNPNLAMRYGVRSIPAVKAFQQGQVVAEFTGAQPEPRVRDFIRGLAPSQSDLAQEKAESLLHLHQWSAAERGFRQILEQTPGQPPALLGLAKSLLAQGRSGEVAGILRTFPSSREYATAQLLLPLAEAMNDMNQGKLPEDDPLGAAFRNSLRLASRGNIPSALDGMLDILRQEKQYLNGRVRQAYLGLLELLGDEDPQTRQYRAELASVLF